MAPWQLLVHSSGPSLVEIYIVHLHDYHSRERNKIFLFLAGNILFVGVWLTADGITHPKGTCWICLYEVLARSGCTKESYVGCDHWMQMGLLRLSASYGASCARGELNWLIGQGKDVRIAQPLACALKKAQ